MRGRRSRGTAPPSSRLRGAWLRAVTVSGVAAGTLALGVPVANAAGDAGGSQATASTTQPAASAAQTTEQYVIRFWPRWITYFQQQAFPVAIGVDRLGGPKVMGPMFRTVNLINNDTLYTAGVVKIEPVARWS